MTEPVRDADTVGMEIAWRTCDLCGVPIASETCTHVERIGDRIVMSAVEWERLVETLARLRNAQDDGLAEPSTVEGESKLPQTPTARIDGGDGRLLTP